MMRRLATLLYHLGWPRLARLVAGLAPPPTDRAHLLMAPEKGDACDAWTPTYPDDGPPNCRTDGHYLCEGCGRRVVEPKLIIGEGL